MKRITIFLVVSVCLLLIVAYPRGGSASPNPFSGNWKGIDSYDGSHLTMWIVEEARSGGKVFNIHQTDDQTGSWCGGGQAGLNAVGVSAGENSIAVSWVWWCFDTSKDPIYFGESTLTYDPSTNMIAETYPSGTNYYKRIP